ncbi:MAG: radical SAM/SPASM domain-containing protein [Patescibacteria group bacterium]
MFKKIKRKIKQQLGSLILPFWPQGLYYFGFSGHVIIEATNSCNLRCRFCPTWQSMKRAKGFMSLENFKKIIDQDGGIIKNIDMNFAGEPTLNPDVFKMVKYASQNGINVLISTNTTLIQNFSFAEIFDSGLKSLIVCLDGTTAEVYLQHRQGGDFEVVKENIKKLCEEKKKRQLEFPIISLQFVVTKNNEKQIPEIIKLAKDVGVNNLNLKTLSLGSFVDLGKKLELAKEYLPNDNEYSRFEIKDDKVSLKSRPKYCSWLRQTVIFWNGDVTMCCYDYNGDMTVGNVFTGGGLKAVLKSAKYKKYRKLAIKRQLKLCQNCNLTSDYGKTIRFN